MTPEKNSFVPPGWVGGFAQSKPAFAYPKPNLSSLPMLNNMDYIKKLKRQQKVKWPEFSWETQPGQTDPKRCFQMFAPYISRIGYTNEGRVYSIICPQQGVWLHNEICLNVEVTVTGQRGWVDEIAKTLAADMQIEAKIWFSPSEHQGDKLRQYWSLIKVALPDFPLDKTNAIRVTAHHPGEPDQPIFPVRKGETTLFTSPPFAKHPEAWTVGNVEVEIGPIEPTHDSVVDKFNTLVMTAFNLASGNMLQPGNVLSWNVWFTAPQLVCVDEWKNHAGKWRNSIDAHHGYPQGPGTKARYFDGTYFNAEENALEEAIEAILKYIEKQLEAVY